MEDWRLGPMQYKQIIKIKNLLDIFMEWLRYYEHIDATYWYIVGHI